jgi:hypothetical protein
MKPHARQEELLLTEVGDELVVYDLERHRVHQLNRTAALVWRGCNGHRSVADLTKLLQRKLDPAADEALVWKPLERLAKARLLREPSARPASSARLTRRQALRKLSRSAALVFLAPVVTSITAPTPLQASRTPIFSKDPCESQPCSTGCKDKCKKNDECPNGHVCRSLSCPIKDCASCMQRKCMPANKTPSSPKLMDSF